MELGLFADLCLLDGFVHSLTDNDAPDLLTQFWEPGSRGLEGFFEIQPRRGLPVRRWLPAPR